MKCAVAVCGACAGGRAAFSVLVGRLGGWVVLLAALSVAGQEFSCETNNGTITITGYSGPDSVTIPSMINGLPVTRIGDDTFYWFFGANTDPASVLIPDTVTNIGHSAFKYCVNLSTITVDALNPAYASVDGVLFDKSQTTLIRYPPGQTLSSYAIPEGVSRIEDNALEYCRLFSIAFPESVTSIGTNAFASCRNLTTIALPGKVANIGAGTFSLCANLAGITIPHGVTNIGPGAFQSCTSLDDVTIPGSVIRICEGAFDDCAALSSVVLSNGITAIADQAFFYCRSLTNIALPASITSIGVGTFGHCPSLLAIEADPMNPGYSSLDGVLFNKNQTMLLQYPGARAGSYAIPGPVTAIADFAFTGCTNLTSITIPDGVNRIGTSSFDTCTRLATVRLPSGLTSIGEAAFLNCVSLTTITLPPGVTSIGSYAFIDCTNMAGLYCMGDAPGLGEDVFMNDHHSTVFYLPGRAGWGPTFGGIPTAPWFLHSPLLFSSTLGNQGNAFGFTVSWSTNLSLVVETSTKLAQPTWQPLQTNALTNGSFQFKDSDWANYPQRFYRVRQQ